MASKGKIIWVLVALILMGLMVGACKKPRREGTLKGMKKAKFILNDDDLLQAAAVAIIADHFGLDVDLVVKVKRAGKVTTEDLVLLFALLYLAGSDDADFAVGLRGKGHGWGEIAHRLGIHPSTFNKLRKRVLGPAGALKRGKWQSDEDFKRGLFIIVLSDRFGVEATLMREKVEEGNSLNDLLLALALAQRVEEEWTELLEGKKEDGRSWLTIANELEVDLAELDTIAEALKLPPEKGGSIKRMGKREE